MPAINNPNSSSACYDPFVPMNASKDNNIMETSTKIGEILKDAH